MKRLLVALVGAILMLAGCGQSDRGTSADAETPPRSTQATGPTTVFAAASLNKAFPLAAEGTDVSFSFDGSSGLVDQIVGGAPADVFASADQRNMDKAVAAGVIDGDPVMFATNYLVLVVPAGNPGNVTGFDASLDGARLVVCAPEVPCGGATARVAETNGLALEPVSEESNVTDVLGKVTSGEADAGIVYATDATQAGEKVETLQIPGANEDPNTYWIAKVTNAPNPAGADDFLALITGERGQKALTEFGFGPPR
ncbi:molybdate ABC transporter substrate-binding protein [Granulicoccus sp. GXG6511]|uniref:molybdate ABC transporter substrate-binding protein n=1 Tax=Granulicoccus sp. GXG6511 TaxID=3381351 RepID=UPI003D7E54E8